MRKLFLYVISACYLIAGESFAAVGATTDVVPLQEFAQGQALTGANLLNDSIYSNPASSSFIQVYSLEGTFQSMKSFSASVLDTRTSAFGGGLAYSRRAQADESSLQIARLALSGRIASNIGIGLTGKMMWAADSAGDTTRANDLDVGVLWNARSLPIQLGAVGKNLISNARNVGLDREYAVGVRTHYEETLFISANLVNRFEGSPFKQFGVGMEYVSPYYFSLKGGYRQRIVEGWAYWSTGFSINSPRVSLHYAVEFPTLASQNPEHLLGATVLF